MILPLHTMIFFRTLLATAVIATAFFFATGCNDPITDYDREKVYLDSLQRKLNTLELGLNIDEEELKGRIAQVNSWYIKLNDTAYDIAKKMQIEFNGFKVVYQNYIDNYFVYFASLESLKKEYKTLLSQVNSKKLTRSEFKKMYAGLKNEIDLNLIKTEKIAQPVYDLELNWRRYEQMMAQKQPHQPHSQ